MGNSRGLGLEWDAEEPEVGKMKSGTAHPPTGPAFGCVPSKNPPSKCTLLPEAIIEGRLTLLTPPGVRMSQGVAFKPGVSKL